MKNFLTKALIAGFCYEKLNICNSDLKADEKYGSFFCTILIRLDLVIVFPIGLVINWVKKSNWYWVVFSKNNK